MSGYGNFAYYYDRLTDNVDYKKRCDYICSLLTENHVGKGILLDLACGTGTMSMLLAEKGYEIVGVDASEDMLSVAQEKKINTNADAVFLCQKMQELDLFGTIDAAVCTLDSLNHITDESDLREALRRVALFMNDGGIFVFDINTPYKHKHVLADNTFIYDLDEVYCVWQNTFNESDCSTTVQLDIFEQDEDEEDVYYRYSEEFCERGYELDKIQSWLEDVQFEVLGIYNEMTKDKIDSKTERAVFVCKKHGTQFLK
ncbi:MAG: class I SAM-dependent methyltransferase [Faecalibacterium sp.]|nr:class I SAM-dependent methyltransferase [Ruminococcus sp.]MCM1392590.1 class I SAM-dependent methyltransferase [Ruminococcus sp.]MCM1486282.1 class I SAM-dependent methyltransferase [Faecalibacterium sp.]